MNEPEPVNVVVTCHTKACRVENLSFTLQVYPNAEEPVYRVVCGQCHEDVTDIVAA
ncbi:hypothetical protein [Streptomyces sp. NPDC058252]|uniref:hypothetical protein n=1 Tax=Streptomyces sp. NPDC058252 TaxID=3346405 RepID=UPI0036E7E6F6